MLHIAKNASEQVSTSSPHNSVKRITDDEKLMWHPDIDVYFQPNALMDTNVTLQWYNQNHTYNYFHTYFVHLLKSKFVFLFQVIY